MGHAHKLALAVLLAGIPFVYAGTAQAANEITCTMGFEMHGWSAFYKKADGLANVACSNGQHMQVHLRSRGGGLTVGKYSLTGTGTFTGVFDINSILGTYATAGAHAGVINSARAVVLTKGTVSLTMKGTGQGWDLGVDFGKLTISR